MYIEKWKWSSADFFGIILKTVYIPFKTIQGIELKTNQNSEPLSRFKEHQKLSEEDEENILFILQFF
jgi:hypothetical protein